MLTINWKTESKDTIFCAEQAQVFKCPEEMLKVLESNERDRALLDAARAAKNHEVSSKLSPIEVIGFRREGIAGGILFAKGSGLIKQPHYIVVPEGQAMYIMNSSGSTISAIK